MNPVSLKTQASRFFTWKIICLIWLVSRCLPIHAQRYVEISAEIETTTYNLVAATNAVADKSRIFSLVCTFGTNEWRVDNNFPRGGEEKWFYDGTNVYNGLRLTQPQPNLPENKLTTQVANLPFEKAKSNWTIYLSQTPHGHPLGNVGVNIPWLAFCSGTYLRNANRIIPLPVATLRITPEGFGYTDKTETFTDELGLPRYVDLFTSDAQMDAAVRRFNKDYLKEVQRNRSMIADGCTVFHYEVTQSTNFKGWTIPLRFTYVQNQFMQDGTPLPRYTGVGTVTAIRDTSKPEGIFLPQLQQTVVDYRFRNPDKKINALIYPTTNSSALPTNSPNLKAQFEARVRRSPKPTSSFLKRQAIFTAILLVSVVPLIVVFLLHRQKTNKSKML